MWFGLCRGDESYHLWGRLRKYLPLSALPWDIPDAHLWSSCSLITPGTWFYILSLPSGTNCNYSFGLFSPLQSLFLLTLFCRPANATNLIQKHEIQHDHYSCPAFFRKVQDTDHIQRPLFKHLHKLRSWVRLPTNVTAEVILCLNEI